MLQDAGCALLAVHGRTREQKDTTAHRADWAAIAAVRAALDIPVLANGDVRDTAEAAACMAATGCVGVLSAEPLLRRPDLFSGVPPEERPFEWPALLALEYCALAAEHPTPPRMVRGHVHKLLGEWLAEFTDLRDQLNAPPQGLPAATAVCQAALERLRAMAAAGEVRGPVPRKFDRAAAKEAARAAAVEEQAREEEAVAALDAGGERKRAREEGSAGGWCE